MEEWEKRNRKKENREGGEETGKEKLRERVFPPLIISVFFILFCDGLSSSRSVRIGGWENSDLRLFQQERKGNTLLFP